MDEILEVIEEHKRLRLHAAAEIDSDPGDATAAGRELLTPRETEIPKLIAQGQSSKKIARRLEISPRTVSTHRSSLMKKLHIHTTAGLVRYALKVGIVEE